MNSLKGGMIWTVRSFKQRKSGSLFLTDVDVIHNLVPTEGLNHILSSEFKGGTQVTTWYGAIFEGNYTPSAGDTAASFSSDATECTTYTQATRVEWIEGSVAGGAVDNTLNVMVFTMSANKTIYGAALLSAAAKGATSGVLSSIARFSTPKINQDRLEVTGGYVLESA